jgi:hypothetical protein
MSEKKIITEKRAARGGATIFLRGMSKPVKQMFKKKCVGRELAMVDVVEALMRFYLHNSELVEDCLNDVLKSKNRTTTNF